MFNENKFTISSAFQVLFYAPLGRAVHLNLGIALRVAPPGQSPGGEPSFCCTKKQIKTAQRKPEQ